MTAATARAKTCAGTSPKKPDYSGLPSVGLNLDAYKVLRVCSFNPSVTANVLQNKLPDVKNVPTTIKSLVGRSLLHRYRTVYNLTWAGWILLSAARLILFPDL